MNFTGLLIPLAMLAIVGFTVGVVIYEEKLVERCNERGGSLIRQPGVFNYRCANLGGFNVGG